MAEIQKCTTLIDWLTSFNAKERFFLVGQALGNKDFALDAAFSCQLGDVLDLEIPNGAFVAMDYHLDWIYAAMYLAEKGATSVPIQNETGAYGDLIRGQQEDVDLLVAFEMEEHTHLIFVEAKGVTSWTTKQIESKAKRFCDIFKKGGGTWHNVVPHLVLMSPDKSRVMEKAKCPSWFPDWFFIGESIPYLKLETETGKRPLQYVTRCDKEGKSPRDKNYTCWKVARR